MVNHFIIKIKSSRVLLMSINLINSMWCALGKILVMLRVNAGDNLANEQNLGTLPELPAVQVVSVCGMIIM